MTTQEIIAESNRIHAERMAKAKAKAEREDREFNERIRRIDASLADSGYYYGIDY
jgi:hypothetical protein